LLFLLYCYIFHSTYNSTCIDHLFPGMSHYMCNTTCYVLPFTLCKFLCFQSSFLTRVKFLVLLCSFFLFFFLYKFSKLIEFTSFLNRHMCLFTSSLFVSDHLPPSFIIPFLRVSLCLFRMGHSLIKFWKFWEPVWQGHVWSSIILNLYTLRVCISIYIHNCVKCLKTTVGIELNEICSEWEKYIKRHCYKQKRL
jgi:hypothetical protein